MLQGFEDEALRRSLKVGWIALGGATGGVKDSCAVPPWETLGLIREEPAAGGGKAKCGLGGFNSQWPLLQRLLFFHDPGNVPCPLNVP